MYCKQTFAAIRATRAGIACSALLAFGGCSMFHHDERETVTPPPVVPAAGGPGRGRRPRR
jgi:hypothetical protein